jgi:hypothetical protein
MTYLNNILKNNPSLIDTVMSLKLRMKKQTIYISSFNLFEKFIRKSK